MNNTPTLQRSIRLIDGSDIRVSQSLGHCTIDLLSVIDELTDPNDLIEHSYSHSPVSSPLLVVRHPEEHYRIVDGAKRFLGYVKEGADYVPCVILDGDIQSTQIRLLRMTANTDRPLTLGEKIGFIRWIYNHLTESRAATAVSRLNIPRKELPALMRLIQLKDWSTVQGVYDGIVSLHSLEDFLSLSEEDRGQLLHHLAGLKPSVQLQKELFGWLPEIAAARQTDIVSLLNDSKVAAILSSTSLNDPQKLQKLREHFYCLRFPTVSAAESRWKRRKQAICFNNKNISVIPDPFFEKKRTEIRIKAQNGKEIVEALNLLCRTDEKQWDLLIDPYLDDCS
ncbi:MAG: hypothetical protein ACLFSB_12230 [Chitinispirillaceae bacterium]